MTAIDHIGDEYGGNGNYTYIIKGLPKSAPFGDPQYPTRHLAAGEKAILEAIHLCDLEIVAQERGATDEANNMSVKTSRERKKEAREKRKRGELETPECGW
jgi:hypothetical protein